MKGSEQKKMSYLKQKVHDYKKWADKKEQEQLKDYQNNPQKYKIITIVEIAMFILFFLLAVIYTTAEPVEYFFLFMILLIPCLFAYREYERLKQKSKRS